MIFHENRLPADDSHEISCLICYFEKAAKLKLSSAANYRWRSMGYYYILYPPGDVPFTCSQKTLSFPITQCFLI